VAEDARQQWAEFVIGGYTVGGATFDALISATSGDNGPIYAGCTLNGFTPGAWVSRSTRTSARILLVSICRRFGKSDPAFGEDGCLLSRFMQARTAACRA
jgi:hypothetical protein